MSTVRGKKSMPSRIPLAALAVTRTTVSPMRPTPAPWAWGASLPVSNDSDFSVPEIGPDTEMASAMRLSSVGWPGHSGPLPVWAAAEPVVRCRTPRPYGPWYSATGSWRPTAASYVFRFVDSAAQAKAGDQRPVALYVVVPDVVEQPAATTDEHQ